MTLPHGPLIRVPRIHPVRVEQDGTKVALVIDGKLAFSAEWPGAMKVGQALITAAMNAKQEAGVRRGLTNGQPPS